MSVLRRPLLLASSAAIAVATSGCDDHDHHAHGPVDAEARLVIGDAEASTVTIVELSTGASVATFPASAQTRVYVSDRPSLGYVYAVERSGNRTQVIYAGLEYSDHGDHGHVYRSTPTLVGSPIAGLLPTHFVAHDGLLTFFHDGDGSVAFVEEDALVIGTAPTTASTEGAHHGVAVAFEGHLLATLASAPDAMGRRTPYGITVRALATPDTILETFDDCPSLHGEATLGTVAAFGCSDGVLLVERTAEGFDAIHLPNPAGATGRVGTLRAVPGGTHFVGNFGPTGLAFVAANGDEPMRTLALDQLLLGMEISSDGELVTLEGDGALRVRDVATFEVLRETPVFDAFVPDGSHGPQPTFTLAGEEAFAVDPRRDGVARVDLHEAEVTAIVPYDGAPMSIAVVSYFLSSAEHAH